MLKIAIEKEKDQGKWGEKAQMPQIVDVAEESCLNSWPGTVQEEVDNQMDTVESYEILNKICEDQGAKS